MKILYKKSVWLIMLLMSQRVMCTCETQPVGIKKLLRPWGVVLTHLSQDGVGFFVHLPRLPTELHDGHQDGNGETAEQHNENAPNVDNIQGRSCAIRKWHLCRSHSIEKLHQTKIFFCAEKKTKPTLSAQRPDMLSPQVGTQSDIRDQWYRTEPDIGT
jgi:hypothetical protein